MNINYDIFRKENLIIQKFSGEWNTDCYEKYIQHSAETIDYSEISKILTDLRFVRTFKIEDEELNRIQSLRDILPIKKFINVHLVNGPVLTVASALYKNFAQKPGNIEYIYCSTLKFALEKLEINISVQEAEDRIQNLKLTF